MIERMMEWAGQSSTAWWVLGVAAAVIVFEAARSSHIVLWGDMVDDED